MLIAVPLATARGTAQGRLRDQVVRAVPIVGLGMPAFWLGIMLILLFAADVWPSSSRSAATATASPGT